MSVMPRDMVDRMQFLADRVQPWTSNATAIGTTAQQVTDLDTKVTATRAAYDAQQAAQAAAKAATETLKNAYAAMSGAGSAIIAQVHAKAKTAGPGVYPLAQIPAPAIPGPTLPPGKPSNFTVSLQDNGALSLKWKCPNPAGTSGTIYQVWRRIGTGEFAYVGGTGSKQFVDNTVPRGTASLTYQLQAVRSTAVGEWAQFNVNFGVSGTTVVETQPTKIAA